MNNVKRDTLLQVHAHRGDRANFPENSIPAFLSAVKKGVDAIEMDVVISKDLQVVVSHDPYMASRIMFTPEGEAIPKEAEGDYNLFEMTYEEIRRFDTGSKGEASFSGQQKMKTYKPLLKEVIDTVEALIASEGLDPVIYNVEIKSDPNQYGSSQPHPEEFIELVTEVISEKKIKDKVIIQSFDPKILNHLRQHHPAIPISFLVASGTVENNLKQLGFIPEVYSPHFNLIKNRRPVRTAHRKGMKVIPWTVNRNRDILQMIRMRVDGIITDYPGRLLELLESSERS